MLDAIFRSPSDRKQADSELRDLLAELREERDALRAERAEFRAEIEKAGGAIETLASTNKALDELGAKADATMRKVSGLAEVAASYDERARRLETLDQRVGTLVAQLVEAEQAAKELLSPEGHLSQHRKALDALGQQAAGAQAELDAMRRQNEELGQAHSQLHRSADEVRQALEGLSGLEGRLLELARAEEQLRLEVSDAHGVAREARTGAEAAAAAAQDLASRFDSLAKLQELSKDTEKRIGALHALAEHVSSKASALETQKHAIDHAAAETARLNEMVWAMEAQVGKLAEGQEKMLEAEEAVGRIAQMARTASQDLAAATAAREAFLQETERAESQGRTLLDNLRAMAERLALEKGEYSAFDGRLQTLTTSLAESEERMQAVLGKDDLLAAMQQKADGLNEVFNGLRAESEALARRQTALDQLADQLSMVEALGRRTEAQLESLKRTQDELEAMRTEMAGLRKSYADVGVLRDSLTKDRAALEEFVQRTQSMIGRTPEIETRLQSLLDQMGLLEQGNAAAERLAATTRTLNEGLEQVTKRTEFVEKLGERVNALFVMSGHVETRLVALAAQRSEADDLARQCISLGTQIAMANQQLDALSTQQARLLPLTAEVERLGQDLQGTRAAIEAIKQEEATARQQRDRLADLVEQATRQAGATGEQLERLRALGESLAHVSGRREEVLAELSQVQARQADALAQISVTEDQLQRAEAMLRQLEGRRTLLTHAEQKLSGLETRLADLDRLTDGVDRRIKSLADREAMVQAVKAEVDGIRQIASRSKGDLQFVAEHRQEVSDLRGKVDELLSRIGDTDGKIALIESWRRKVDEVQVNADAVNELLTQVHGTLENLSEQRVVIDDVGEKLARLDFTVEEAKSTIARLDASALDSQNMLRTLQREREVAERVATSIKTLRARGSTPPTA